MGKTGVKIQLPDAKKAAKAAKRAALQKLADAVKEADALDPSEALAPFLAKPFVRNGLSTSVEAVPHASALSATDRKWMWNLLEKNMKPVYGSQAWKKEGKEKKEEMLSDDARFLVARNADAPSADPVNTENMDPNEPLGFVHYRFVLEEGAAVLYVYELQIAPGARRRGLGKFLMMLCESLARKARVSGVVLTVQTANAHATKFYESMKYGVSPISPRTCDPWAFEEGEYDYDIYQKVWGEDGVEALAAAGAAAFKENKEMFDAASVFVHSNDELKDAFKKATIAA